MTAGKEAMATEAPLIALIDDDVDCLELTRQIVEAAGYACVSYSDPETAFREMTEAAPDLIVTDLMMTSIDSGFVLSRHVKQIPALADVPIIILTAVGSRLGYDFRPFSETDLAAMQVDGFLEKPVVAKTLVTKIRELLRASKGGA